MIVVERDDDPMRFESLVSPEDLVVPQLGIVALDLTDSVRELLPDLREPNGVVVASTSRDVPPSWEGELEVGDVIHAVNKAAVASVADLRQELSSIKAGQSIVLQVERDGTLRFVSGRIE